jgi:hypothetical protein
MLIKAQRKTDIDGRGNQKPSQPFDKGKDALREQRRWKQSSYKKGEERPIAMDAHQ